MKKIIKKKKLADLPPRHFNYQKAEEEAMLKDMEKSTTYRRKALLKSQLIKPKDKIHQKKLRKQENALGVRVYV